VAMSAGYVYAPERKYTPCDAPKEELFVLRDFLGFERSVIVQASCQGKAPPAWPAPASWCWRRPSLRSERSRSRALRLFSACTACRRKG
jgi:hypothetical protein